MILLLSLLLVRADDLETPGAEVLRELRAALDRNDAAAAKPLLFEAGEIARWPASPGEAADLLALLSEASRRKEAELAIEALRALGASEREEAAAHLEPFLRAVAPKEEEERLAVAAVQAAGRLRAPALLAPLAKLAAKCESIPVAAQALFAMGEFGASPPALRREATARALETAQSLERAGRERWRRLRGPALRALQRLTGRKLNSLSQFEAFLAG